MEASAAPSLPAGAPPEARAEPSAFTLHGTEVRDDFAWLKAPNWKEALKDPGRMPAGIVGHLERENAYTAEALAPLQGLRDKLVAEMRGRIQEDEASVPSPDGTSKPTKNFNANGKIR